MHVKTVHGNVQFKQKIYTFAATLHVTCVLSYNAY